MSNKVDVSVDRLQIVVATVRLQTRAPFDVRALLLLADAVRDAEIDPGAFVEFVDGKGDAEGVLQVMCRSESRRELEPFPPKADPGPRIERHRSGRPLDVL